MPRYMRAVATKETIPAASSQATTRTAPLLNREVINNASPQYTAIAAAVCPDG